jgi:hypothetical protein
MAKLLQGLVQMRFFHKHEWEVIAKTYCPPRAAGEVSSTGMNEGFLERMAFGFTNILLKCAICQKIRKEEMLGLEVPESNNE